MLPRSTAPRISRGLGTQFVVVETDRLFYLTINGERFDWPAHTISGEVVRKLGKITSAAISVSRFLIFSLARSIFAQHPSSGSDMAAPKNASR
jgi:hypothetical protein